MKNCEIYLKVCLTILSLLSIITTILYIIIGNPYYKYIVIISVFMLLFNFALYKIYINIPENENEYSQLNV